MALGAGRALYRGELVPSRSNQCLPRLKRPAGSKKEVTFPGNARSRPSEQQGPMEAKVATHEPAKRYISRSRYNPDPLL